MNFNSKKKNGRAGPGLTGSPAAEGEPGCRRAGRAGPTRIGNVAEIALYDGKVPPWHRRQRPWGQEPDQEPNIRQPQQEVVARLGQEETHLIRVMLVLLLPTPWRSSPARSFLGR